MKKSNLNSCNVLQVEADSRQLWQFNISGTQIKPGGASTGPAASPVPPKVARRSLFTRRLNIAWLPADQVFLRVVHLPTVELPELIAMVEFQLEKLSPFPVAQIVWSMELLPDGQNGQQTVVVVIASRDAVEKFLGRIEQSKFLADQLELPQLHLLLSARISGDGVWILPTPVADRVLCLVAWWSNGSLQQVQLVQVPAGPGAVQLLVAQLNETAWAGELEGWFKLPLRVHLVAEAALAAEWDAALRDWSADAVVTTAPLSTNALAELAASRAALGQSKSNLLPADYTARYRQQFVDRLWMSGLGALVATYIVGVLVYFGVLYAMGWQKDHVVQQVRAISGSYTNALRAKEKIEVLQTQLDLRFAALDALQSVSDSLPTGFVLTQFTFSRGRTLDIAGTAPQGEEAALTAFASKLRTIEVDGRLVFKSVATPVWSLRGATINWSLRCELKLTGD